MPRSLSAPPADAPDEPATPDQPAAADAEPATGSPWTDLQAYVALPRLGGLVVGGDRLLVSVAALDADRTTYTSAWWQLDPTGQAPARRCTRSVEGESAAALLSDGSLLFTSRRTVPTEGDDGAASDTSAVWCLPAGGGEAYVLARRTGGWQGVAAARDGMRAVFAVGRLASAADEVADGRLRALRKKRSVSAILHEGYPVRSFDHDLGTDQTRLLAVDLADAADPVSGDLAPDPAAFTDLLPDAADRVASAVSLSATGDVAVLDWSEPRPGGVSVTSVALVDTTNGELAVLAAADDDVEYHDGVVAPDGSRVACVQERRSTPERAGDQRLWLVDRTSGESRQLAPDWDAWPVPHAFSPDGGTLYVTVDEAGHAPVYAVDVATGDRRRLTGDGACSSVRLSADGRTLYAVRSSYLDPGSVVAVDLAGGDVTELRVPVDYPELPGRLEEVETVTADGARVRGYLALPPGASAGTPAPLALWVHGGPLGSWNAWSWRWCPWLLVSRGYAVLLPDPALSTGYGFEFVQRGWGQWGGTPYTDLMAVTDAVLERDDLDAGATVAMGGSYGGYLANWIAGHTDRFRAIVTHASLWNLETFGATTDYAWYWARELTPQAQAEYSPHRFADQITTPMLVVHGDRDYRVPISEGVALWWALVSGHQGPPEELPHRYLYFPDENHWVLSPQHAVVWYETVLAFLEQALHGGNFARPETL